MLICFIHRGVASLTLGPEVTVAGEGGGLQVERPDTVLLIRQLSSDAGGWNGAELRQQQQACPIGGLQHLCLGLVSGEFPFHVAL
jgi:hypothetical protein